MKLGMADLFNPSSELTPEQMVDIAKTLLEQFQDSKIPINLDFILDEDLKDSAANIDQRLENLVYNTINKKYKLQPGTPFHVLDPDTQETFYEDQDRLNEFIMKSTSSKTHWKNPSMTWTKLSENTSVKCHGTKTNPWNMTLPPLQTLWKIWKPSISFPKK